MTLNEETYHRINDFLTGDMKGRDLDKFKADLKSDQELSKALETQRNIIVALEAHRANELKQFITKGIAQKSTFIISPKIRVALATAAVVAILSVVFIALPDILPKSSETTEVEEPSTTEHIPEEEIVDSKTIQPEKIITPANTIDTQTLAIVTPSIDKENILMDESEMADEDLDSNIQGGNDSIAIPETSLADIANDNTSKDENQIGNEPILDKKVATNIDKSDIKVLKDELLASYSVSLVSLDFDQELAKIETAKDYTEDLITRVDEEESTTPENKKTSNVRSISVEHWRSVVNYKGYRYNGNTVQLYGIDTDFSITFKELDKRLYMRINQTHYFLEKNKDYKRLAEVTNPTLLKVLND